MGELGPLLFLGFILLATVGAFLISAKRRPSPPSRWTFRAPTWVSQSFVLLLVFAGLGALSGVRIARIERSYRPPVAAMSADLFWVRVTEEVRVADRVGWKGRVLAFSAGSWDHQSAPFSVRGWDALPNGLYLVGGSLRENRSGSTGPRQLRTRCAFRVSGPSSAPGSSELPLRYRLAKSWSKELRPPAGELAAWTILGVAPRDRTRWKRPFLDSGTAHLLAISGLHLGLLVMGLGQGVKLVSGGRASPIWTLIALAAYGTWIGWPASVRRAGLMTSLSIAGPGWGRFGRVWNALGWTVALLPLIDPASPRQAGFVFSVSATVGVLLGGEWAVGLLKRLPSSRLTSHSGFRSGMGAFGASLGASLLTGPATFWVAGWLPMAGIAINLLAIPIMAIVFPVLVIASVMISLGWQGPNPLTTTAEVLSAYLVAVIEESAEWGRATAWAGREDWAGTWGATVLAGAFLWALSRQRIRTQLWGGLLLLPVLAQSGHTVSPPLSVCWLSVGQGDAVLLESGKATWLFDVGPPGSPAPVVRALLNRGVSHLDRVFISHGDLDHWGGWEDLLASPVRVDTLVLSREKRDRLPDAFWEGVTAASQNGRPPVIEWIEQDATMALGQSHCATLLHPGTKNPRGEAKHSHGGDGQHSQPGQHSKGAQHDGPAGTEKNAASMVLSIARCGEKTGSALVLLTADLGEAQERRVMRDYPDLRTEVLHAGHHGSGTSTSLDWLIQLSPRLGVISVGEGNRYGLPEAGLLTRLEERNIAVLRTDRDGDVGVTFRGGIPIVSRPSLTFSETDR